MKKFLDQEGTKIAKERLLRIMSNRKSLKKDDPTQRRSPTMSNDRLNDSVNNYYHATQEEIEIAKTPWVDEISDEELRELLAD